MNNVVHFIEMPEHDSISVCLSVDQPPIFGLGERIHQVCEAAYMNGYNWEAVIRFYVAQKDPELMQELGTDPEAGMFSAYMSYSKDNLEKMKRFEAHLRELLSDEGRLLEFVKEHRDAIEWD